MQGFFFAGERGTGDVASLPYIAPVQNAVHAAAAHDEDAVADS
jgi:hypothetical protein